MNKKTVAIIITLLITVASFTALFILWPAPGAEEAPVASKYENAELGFSVKYPPEWAIDTSREVEGMIYVSGPSKIGTGEKDVTIAVYDSVQSIPGNDDGLPLKDFVIGSSSYSAVRAVIIDKKLGYAANTSDPAASASLFVEGDDGRAYVISMAEEDPSEEILSVANSFRFIEGELK
jgi:hypothetical protein